MCNWHTLLASHTLPLCTYQDDDQDDDRYLGVMLGTHLWSHRPPLCNLLANTYCSSCPSHATQNVECPSELIGLCLLAVERARVLYEYKAENDDELSIEPNQTIIVLCKTLDDSGWWRGELNGKVGVFPDNFVELLPEEVTVCYI